VSSLLRLLLLVPLAYILAVFAAGWVIAYALFGPADGGEAIDFFTGSVIALSLYAGAVSFVPALVAVILAEAFAWRSPFYYLAVGAVIGFAGDRLSGFIGPVGIADRRPVVYLAAGFVAGIVYWLIAGRRAGADRPPVPPPAQSARSISIRSLPLPMLSRFRRSAPTSPVERRWVPPQATLPKPATSQVRRWVSASLKVDTIGRSAATSAAASAASIGRCGATLVAIRKSIRDFVSATWAPIFSTGPRRW
jgi:hypothetical protein